MKNKTAFILVVSILLMSIFACDVAGDLGAQSVRGSGTVVEESRDIGDISAVELATQGRLYIEMGGSESLRIEADDNLMEYIETDVRASKLVIDNRRGTNLRPSQPINYYLTVDELDTIEISSSGDIEAGDLESGSFSLSISSSGDLTIEGLEATSLDVRISSSGDLEILGGQVQQQDIIISSSGKYTAENLASAEAEVNLTSSGTAIIQISERLSGRLSSSGDVRYIGNPDVNVSTSSSGRAVQISE
jgi:hypothetical protein